MNLPTKVKYTEPPTRPLTELEKAQAEIIRLRARVKEFEKLVSAKSAKKNAQFVWGCCVLQSSINTS